LGQSGNNVLKEKTRGILQQAQLLYRLRQERYQRKKQQEEYKQRKSKSKKHNLPKRSENEVITEQLKVK
jgi:hypothetical protein